VLSADDLTFVEKVFSTIQHIDVDSPAIEPPPSTIGDAGDRDARLEALEAEMGSIRGELTETQERLDFAERLLAQPRGELAETRPIRPS